jgi:putative hydrolase of the HAD superfamily
VIRAVLWDADGVLQHTPTQWDDRVGAVIGRDRVAAFAEELWSVSARALVGEVDFSAHIELVLVNQGLLDLREDLLATWRDVVPVAHAIEIVTRLRARVPCYLASNQDSHRARVMREHLRYDELFDGHFFSCDLGAVKPDPAYFDRVVHALDLPAGAILFVDDLDDNVAAARSAGLRASRWQHEQGPEALTKILETHGL